VNKDHRQSQIILLRALSAIEREPLTSHPATHRVEDFHGQQGGRIHLPPFLVDVREQSDRLFRVILREQHFHDHASLDDQPAHGARCSRSSRNSRISLAESGNGTPPRAASSSAWRRRIRSKSTRTRSFSSSVSGVGCAGSLSSSRMSWYLSHTILS